LIQANHACLRLYFDDNDRYGVWYVPIALAAGAGAEWKTDWYG
jgi:hypothetical protein